jgi:hypothetical protein
MNGSVKILNLAALWDVLLSKLPSGELRVAKPK